MEPIISRKKRIVIIKDHFPVEKDPRVTKIQKMLGEDYSVTYVGWDVCTTSYFSCERRYFGEYEEIVMHTKAQLGHSFFLFPLWWFFGFAWLMALNWTMIHVINFPSAVPAVLAAKLKNLPVIYDVEDTYIDQLHAHYVRLRNVGLQIEKLFLSLVDAVVLVDEMQIEEFDGVPNRNIVVVYDSPFPVFKCDEKVFEGDDFKIFYAGALGKRRRLNIDNLIESIKDIDGLRVIFAGNGDLVEEIISLACKMPDKIVYLGWVPYSKVLEMSIEADLLFSLRDPDPPVQRYICGSKFLEAAMCGKPILVNKETSAAFKVVDADCGIVVDSHNVEEIKNAILALANNGNLCRQLGTNGRKAYEQRYSWTIMKRRLLSLYSQLI